jgi:hypothetical protein
MRGSFVSAWQLLLRHCHSHRRVTWVRALVVAAATKHTRPSCRVSLCCCCRCRYIASATVTPTHLSPSPTRPDAAHARSAQLEQRASATATRKLALAMANSVCDDLSRMTRANHADSASVSVSSVLEGVSMTEANLLKCVTLHQKRHCHPPPPHTHTHTLNTCVKRRNHPLRLNQHHHEFTPPRSLALHAQHGLVHLHIPLNIHRHSHFAIPHNHPCHTTPSNNPWHLSSHAHMAPTRSPVHATQTRRPLTYCREGCLANLVFADSLQMWAMSSTRLQWMRYLRCQRLQGGMTATPHHSRPHCGLRKCFEMGTPLVLISHSGQQKLSLRKISRQTRRKALPNPNNHNKEQRFIIQNDEL